MFFARKGDRATARWKSNQRRGCKAIRNIADSETRLAARLYNTFRRQVGNLPGSKVCDRVEGLIIIRLGRKPIAVAEARARDH